MFCANCGKYNPDGAKKCAYCGCEKLRKDKKIKVSDYGFDKTLTGVLMCIFLDVIGLIIGILMYPSGTTERETFLRGWLKTFIVIVILAVVALLVFLAMFRTGCFDSYLYY